MKKILLTGFLAMPGMMMAQTTILSDNFDSYTAGATIAVASAGLWEPWSGGSGTSEDPFVSNAFSNSPSNSMNVYNNGPAAYLHDVVLAFPSTYTTGNYELKMKYYVPAGSGGYFNLGSVWATGGAGYQYGLDVFFNADGSGNVNTASTGVFSYTQNAWTTISVMVNPGTGTCELFINSVSVFSGSWAATNGFGVMDVFGIAFTDATNATQTTSNFYVDDVELLDWTGVGITESAAEINMNVFPNPNNGEFTIQFSDLNAANYELTVTDITGNVVHNESVSANGSLNKTIGLNVASGIYFAELNGDGKKVVKKLIIK